MHRTGVVGHCLAGMRQMDNCRHTIGPKHLTIILGHGRQQGMYSFSRSITAAEDMMFRSERKRHKSPIFQPPILSG